MYLVKPKQATVSKGMGAIVQVDGPRQKEVVGGLGTIVVLQSESLSGRHGMMPAKQSEQVSCTAGVIEGGIWRRLGQWLRW